jgi:hypothetical protein
MTQEQLRMQMLAGIITEGQYKAKLNENEENIADFLNQHKDETFENILKPVFENVLEGQIENISLFDKYKTLNWNQGTQEEYEYAELSIDEKLKLENGEDLFMKLGFQASFSPFPEEIEEEYGIGETMIDGRKIYSFSFDF